MAVTAADILDRLQTHLSRVLNKGILKLRLGAADGREDSSKNEKLVSQTLALQFQADSFFSDHDLFFEEAPARFWYDFLVRSPDNKVWIPVNIKISAFGGADNLSSKEGLFYTMTGVNPKAVPHRTKHGKWGINTWEPYCEAMAHYYGANRKADYYFLVVNKRNIGHVFWTSLRQMKKLEPNGNNLPYQADWNLNEERVRRTWDEAASFLMGVFREALILRARVLDQFNESIWPRVQQSTGIIKK